MDVKHIMAGKDRDATSDVKADLLPNPNVAADRGKPWGSSELVAESYIIPSEEPGVKLYIRNKRKKSQTIFTRDNVLLYVHGSPEPAECSFDLALSGASWMDFLAAEGFDVYFVNLRGHGGSTRFAEMNSPPGAHAPLLSSANALADLRAAVNHILERRGLDQLHLMGWSRGCIAACAFAEANPANVNRLVVVGPSYPTDPNTVASAARPPAYLALNRDVAIDRWFGGVPPERRVGFVQEAMIEMWWQTNMECDPEGARQDPPVYRGPCGWYQLADEYLQAKKPFFYDPANIRSPTLLLVGEWDHLNPHAGCAALFEALTGTPEKRLSVIEGATHYMHRENVAGRVICEIADFLKDARKRVNASEIEELRKKDLRRLGA